MYIDVEMKWKLSFMFLCARYLYMMQRCLNVSMLMYSFYHLLSLKMRYWYSIVTYFFLYNRNVRVFQRTKATMKTTYIWPSDFISCKTNCSGNHWALWWDRPVFHCNYWLYCHIRLICIKHVLVNLLNKYYCM